MFLPIFLFLVYAPAAIVLLAVIMALFSSKPPIEDILNDLQNQYDAKKIANQ